MNNFIYPLSKNFKGVCIVVHGLNVTPKIMYEIACEFLKKDIVVNFVTLRGHDSFSENSFSNFLSITPDIWINDLEIAFKEVKNKYENLPLYYVGYSLGGLLGVNYILKNKKNYINDMHLFAPALSLVWYTKLLKLLKIFKYFNISIPGQTPKEYRAHNLTPLQAFHSLGVLIDNLFLLKDQSSSLNKIKTYIYYHPKDELVSTRGLKLFIESYNLSNWNMQECNYKTKFKHLFVAKSELTPNDYKDFKFIISKNIK